MLIHTNTMTTTDLQNSKRKRNNHNLLLDHEASQDAEDSAVV